MFVSDHDPNLKGNVAELKIAAEAARLGVPVLRPMTEHERYDLVFELGEKFFRVQCKWACRKGDVIIVRGESSRRTADGFLRRPYTAEEVDALAAYCPEVDCCYLIPIAAMDGMRQLSLRVAPTKNGQRACLNWAADYELSGAIAQLGERLHGMQEVVGSSPTSSTLDTPVTVGAHEYRNHFGWYMERAAAGESFLITRRGRPYARLSPPHEQLDLPAPEPAEVVPITTAKERTA